MKASIIVEGANGPVTPDADAILEDNGVLILPDVLANAGGVVVSYFEWVQGLQEYFWKEAEVNAKLNDIVSRAFEATWETAQSGRPDAGRRLRARRPAGRRGHDHAWDLPVEPQVVALPYAAGCHLCVRARGVVADRRSRARLRVSTRVDITGDPALEAEYREWLPVVEIDGRRRFTYFVPAGGLPAGGCTSGHLVRAW